MENPSLLVKNLRTNLPAAVVVFLVAVPLCLGIALASGAPLVSGLVSGVVGGIVVGSFSGSRLGVSGPAAGLAVIVLSSIQELGSFEIFLTAVMLAGLLQLALGFIGAGVLAYYFPSTVISGMLAGIGVIIFLKQLPHAAGYDKDPEGDLTFSQTDGENTLSELWNIANHISYGPLLIALVALTVLIAWESEWFKRQAFLAIVPGPLVAIVAGVLLSWGFQGNAILALETDQFVAIPAAASVLDYIRLPDLSGLATGAVYQTALVIAVVASLETLLSVEATDKLDPRKHITPTNQELRAQGIGNLIVGLLGGLPVTQVIVRSSANIQAGGTNKTSAICHGLLLLLSVIWLPSLLNQIPLAALAAILLVVGYKLAKPSLFARVFRQGPAQYLPFSITVGGVVFTDLLTGIGLGLVAAILGLLVENLRLPHHVSLPDQIHKGHLRITLAQHVTFLNKASILYSLRSIPDGVSVEIDASESLYVHADVVEIIDDFVEGASERDIRVKIVGLEHHQKGHPEASLTITGSFSRPPLSNSKAPSAT